MSNNEKNGGSITSYVLTFLTGAAIGAAIALLYAPQSGKETRARLKDVADDVKDKITDLVDDTKDFIAEQKRAVASAVDAGREAMKRAYKDEEL